MIYIRKEGEPIRNGISFWGMNDPGSRGFILRIGGWMLKCRYSLMLKEWIIYTSRMHKDGFWYLPFPSWVKKDKHGNKK